MDPALKLVITKSSIESAKASRAPATTPGMIGRRVTRRNVCKLLAPRSWAASSRAVEADEAGSDRDDDERDVEHDVSDQDRREAAGESDRDEQRQQRGAQDDLGGGQGRKMKNDRRPAAELVAHEREAMSDPGPSR